MIYPAEISYSFECIDIYFTKSLFVSFSYEAYIKSRGFYFISLSWSTTKVQKLFFQKTKREKPQMTTKFTPFLQGNLAENRNLASISNCKCEHE